MLIKRGDLEVSVGEAVGHVFASCRQEEAVGYLSPWISPEYAKLAIKKKEEGVDVQIVTTNDYGNDPHRGFPSKIAGGKNGCGQGKEPYFADFSDPAGNSYYPTGFRFSSIHCPTNFRRITLHNVSGEVCYYWAPKIGEGNLTVYDRFSWFTHSKFT